jgi:Flp pilus assembly pilin Flp
MNTLKRLWKEEEGQDLIEYALLVVLIAVALAGFFPAVATSIQTTLQKGCTALGTAC